MTIVTLTTDLGTTDHYLAALKGRLLSAAPYIHLIDVTHDIPNFDIVRAAYELGNTWQHFPAGTIHLASVHNFYADHRAFVAVAAAGQYFIGPNNGLFSLMFDDDTPVEQLVGLPAPAPRSMAMYDRFAEAVGALVKGKTIGELGNPIEALHQRLTFHPVVKSDMLSGTIIHVDTFDNAVTNIREQLFQQVANGRSFSLHFKRHDPIRKLSWHYFDVPVGEPLCLFNTAGYLEIAIHLGRAATLLGLAVEDTITIHFE